MFTQRKNKDRVLRKYFARIVMLVLSMTIVFNVELTDFGGEICHLHFSAAPLEVLANFFKELTGKGPGLGSDGTNEVYVYQITFQGKCPKLPFGTVGVPTEHGTIEVRLAPQKFLLPAGAVLVAIFGLLLGLWKLRFLSPRLMRRQEPSFA